MKPKASKQKKVLKINQSNNPHSHFIIYITVRKYLNLKSVLVEVKQMSTYQTPESKKQEFRKYLEKSGVIDALTKVLVGLYEEPERPSNAVDYIKRYMGAPAGIDVEALRMECEQLKAEKAALENTVKELNQKLTG
eukprot:gene11624-15570_t